MQDWIADDSSASDLDVKRFLEDFGSAGDTPLKARDFKAYVPDELVGRHGDGFPLFGRECAETESFYVVGAAPQGNVRKQIGTVLGKGEAEPEGTVPLTGRWDESGRLLLETDGGNPVRVIPYDPVGKLFSRNSGLLESDAMVGKSAIIVGCGSVGSLAAMELARSGVGRFILCDPDTLEIHNICRHQCGFSDLGRYKVDAVRDKILDINPRADVVAYHDSVQYLDDELLPAMGEGCIVFAGGDNRESSAIASRLAVASSTPFVATACWTRAHAGEVFWWAPGSGMPCYDCAFEKMIDGDRPQSHSHYFGTDKEVASLSFEPGIAADIDYVTIVGVKIALDLLNAGSSAYTTRLIDTLRQFVVVCNTNKENIGGEGAGLWAPLNVQSLGTTPRKACPYCGGAGQSAGE